MIYLKQNMNNTIVITNNKYYDDNDFTILLNEERFEVENTSTQEQRYLRFELDLQNVSVSAGTLTVKHGDVVVNSSRFLMVDETKENIYYGEEN